MKTVGLLVLILSQCDVSLSQDTTDKLQDITDNEHYAASNVNYDDGGMGPMFDFARSFINTALPGGFPKEFVNGKF